MLVCHCEAVSDRVIRQCVRDGSAASIEAVGDCTGAGTCCGGCHGSIEQILEEEALARMVMGDAVRPGLRRLPVARPETASPDLSEVA